VHPEAAAHRRRVHPHIVDEFTRAAMEVRCRWRIDADHTVARLERILAETGRGPELIRCDNRPELTANALRDWCRFSKTGSAYIEPGSPWQNPSSPSARASATSCSRSSSSPAWPRRR
jgi:hypothetical protein